MMMDENRREEMLKKRRERRRKNLIFIGCGLLVSIFLLIALFLTGQMGIRTTLGVTSVEQYDLIETEGIEQEIRINYNYLDSLFLFVVNIEEGQEGKLLLKLTDETGRTVFSKEYPLKSIEIGTFQKFPVHKFLEQGNYILEVNYSGEVPEYGIPKVMALEEKKNLDETGDCYLQGQLQEKSLALGYECYQFPYWVWLAIAAVITLIAFLASDSD